MANISTEERQQREAAARTELVRETEERVRRETEERMRDEFQKEQVAAAEKKLAVHMSDDDRQRGAAIRPALKSRIQHHSVRDAASVAAALRDDRVTADEGHDKFHIDPRDIPDGWTYQWRRLTIMGKEDTQYQNGLARRGWSPVPQDRHPDIEVQQDGVILMEIPTVIYEEQKERDERKARLQVASKEAQLVGETPEGHLPRTTFRGQKPISKSFESYQPIPD